MLKLSASAIALIIGLLLASVITAAQADPAQPVAQMNRALYPTLKVAGNPYVPAHSARKPRSAADRALVPVAQMNRALYPALSAAGQPYVPQHSARRGVPLPHPVAQMNRASYPALSVTGQPYVPQHSARRGVPLPHPVAQMNSASRLR
jgi:hypothetical protein